MMPNILDEYRSRLLQLDWNDPITPSRYQWLMNAIRSIESL